MYVYIHTRAGKHTQKWNIILNASVIHWQNNTSAGQNDCFENIVHETRPEKPHIWAK